MRYYGGWDAGAWHCDRNAESRDALVILMDRPAGLMPVGRPFWGNLRPDLSAHCGPELLSAILGRCDVPLAGAQHVVVAINTPLAWPTAALRLLASSTTAAVPEASCPRHTHPPATVARSSHRVCAPAVGLQVPPRWDVLGRRGIGLENTFRRDQRQPTLADVVSHPGTVRLRRCLRQHLSDWRFDPAAPSRAWAGLPARELEALLVAYSGSWR